MISGPTEPREIFSLGWRWGNEGEHRTEWYFELWCELNRFAYLIHATFRRIVQEPLKMKDKN